MDPWSGEGKYVLPVGGDFREFLSFVLYCRGSSTLALLYGMSEESFRSDLVEMERERAEYAARTDAVLSAIAREFDLTPADPFEKVKALQASFDLSALEFSDEYYDVLGLERPK